TRTQTHIPNPLDAAVFPDEYARRDQPTLDEFLRFAGLSIDREDEAKHWPPAWIAIRTDCPLWRDIASLARLTCVLRTSEATPLSSRLDNNCGIQRSNRSNEALGARPQEDHPAPIESHLHWGLLFFSPMRPRHGFD